MNDLRIGIIYPSDGVLDREFWQFAPPLVTMHVTRVRFPDPSETPETLEMLRALVDEDGIDEAAQLLRAIRPDAIAYACTSVSFAGGHIGDRSIIDRVSHRAAAPATSTSSALVAACRALGVRKLAIGAPYLAEITTQFERYLTEAGLESLASHSLGLTEGIDEVEAEDIANLAMQVDCPEAEAIVLACTNLKTYSVIEALERSLGKPVITANQATVWHASRIAGYCGTDGIGHLWGANVLEDSFPG